MLVMNRIQKTLKGLNGFSRQSRLFVHGAIFTDNFPNYSMKGY